MRFTVTQHFALFVFALVGPNSLLTHAAVEPMPFLDESLLLEKRVDDLLPRLTLAEKLGLIHADGKFTNLGVPRLGIPRLWMSDGPHGVREEISTDSWNPAGWTSDFASAMPASIALAATWNPNLAQAYGKVIAEEARQRHKSIMLGPGLNIMRTPLCGRNFEYFGEDPWLTSRLAVGYIQGAQAGGIASCVKHFAANNQETKRGSINVEVDERTLRELYLPAFEAAVREAKVWAVMGAYNKLRGQYCCENDYLLNQVLKHEWGFTGLVMSDWGGVHDTREAVLNGLDLEMGTNKPSSEMYLARAFQEGLERGDYPPAVLDDKVRRVLRVMLATNTPEAAHPAALNTPGHQAIARRVAEEALVLLKNDRSTLPLDLTKLKTIAVIGDNATRRQSHGGWSSEIKAFYEITPLEGIVKRVGTHANVSFAAGYTPPAQRSRNTTEASGVAQMEVIAATESSADELIARAVTAARQADVAIVIAGLNHGTNFDTEGSDRTDLRLPFGQDELIRRVVEANPHTVVVLVSGGPLEMDPWLQNVPAVLQAWYPGMEGGNALSAVLFGDVNPSGKLPCTFPKKLADSPAHALDAFPGTNEVVRYAEGLLVGYRWFDTKKIEPLFPFGFGLSYTAFALEQTRVVPGTAINGPLATVECDVTNTGQRAGSETVQVYVSNAEASVPRPFQELKGFAKVFLNAGEKKTVAIPLNQRAFAFYSPERHGWLAEAGTFTIAVGTSSRDVRAHVQFELKETTAVD